MKYTILNILFVFAISNVMAREYHVSNSGNNINSGGISSPFKTISEAVKHAYPGDTITVHEGIYREWVDPIRGGNSNANRIVYRAAPNEKVEIKGSEVITGWHEIKDGVWKVEIPNSFFGNYNPFQDSVHGDWFHDLGRIHHTGDVYLNGKSLYEKESIEKVYQPVVEKDISDLHAQKYTWYCESTAKTTTIYANFHEYNPNKELIEISSRKTCFYPTKQAVNFITISGFEISQAATQWAAPTAEQIGMIATHWNKEWIIENNVIHDSKCSGITLGKERGTGHNVWSADADNMNRDGNIHYIEVIFRVLRNNWDKEHIGSHIVRNNVIYNCEQAGICGSMGAVFSTIENNHIYNINIKSQFKGWEIGAIKFHAPIDVTIKNNRIHDCERGIWLDWMTQGARVTANVLYRNKAQDLFMEVNHGPFIVDNNIFLSEVALRNWSQGGAYIHNLFLGKIETSEVLDRFTPYFEPHSIDMAGLSTIAGGDDRFINNIIGSIHTKRNDNYDWMLKYDATKYSNTFQGNVYINGVNVPNVEQDKKQFKNNHIPYKLIEKENELILEMDFAFLSHIKSKSVISTSFLGKTKVSKSAFEDPNSNLITFKTDLIGNTRFHHNVNAGPIQLNHHTFLIWKSQPRI